MRGKPCDFRFAQPVEHREHCLAPALRRFDTRALPAPDISRAAPRAPAHAGRCCCRSRRDSGRSAAPARLSSAACAPWAAAASGSHSRRPDPSSRLGQRRLPEPSLPHLCATHPCSFYRGSKILRVLAGKAGRAPVLTPPSPWQAAQAAAALLPAAWLPGEDVCAWPTFCKPKYSAMFSVSASVSAETRVFIMSFLRSPLLYAFTAATMYFGSCPARFGIPGVLLIPPSP